MEPEIPYFRSRVSGEPVEVKYAGCVKVLSVG